MKKLLLVLSLFTFSTALNAAVNTSLDNPTEIAHKKDDKKKKKKKKKNKK